MATKIAIKGLGQYLPGNPISNQELKKLAGIEFDEVKLENKLGIKFRHIAKLRNLPETTADFATQAALNALENAQVQASQVNLLVVGTDTPEYISPATSLLVQGRLQQGENFHCACFDVSASCASFTSALEVAVQMMRANSYMQYGLVIGVYNMPALVRPLDVFGLSIFADGAGAFLLQRDSSESDYLMGMNVSDGTQWNYVGVYAGGTKKPITSAMLAAGEYGLQLLQPLPGDRNVKLWPQVVRELCQRSQVELKAIDHFIFTQINKKVIEEVMAILQQPMEKTTCVMDRYGYTGSACVPIAFKEAVDTGKIQRGDKVMLVASGAGFAVAANLLIF